MPNAVEVTETGAADGPAVTLSAVQKGRNVEWDARIVRSEGVVDERSRVTYAVAQVEAPYQLHADGTPLPIGTFVAADIDGSSALDVIRILRAAVRGADQVLIVDAENLIQIRTIEVIRADAKYVYVTGGVTAGERITTTAIEAPTNGMPVRTADMLTEEATGSDGQIASRVSESE